MNVSSGFSSVSRTSSSAASSGFVSIGLSGSTAQTATQQGSSSSSVAVGEDIAFLEKLVAE